MMALDCVDYKITIVDEEIINTKDISIQYIIGKKPLHEKGLRSL